jgi:hypothetical protein
MGHYLVVGDKFVNLLSYGNVISYPEWKNGKYYLKDKAIFFGQGIMYFILKKQSDIPNWFKKNQTLKLAQYPQHNILLGEIKQTSFNTFHTPLLIDNDHDQLNDHVTGIHVPAIILIEAVKQLTLVLASNFFPQSIDLTNYKLSIDFTSYTFPFPTTISATYHSKKNPYLDVNFLQANEFITTRAQVFLT